MLETNQHAFTRFEKAEVEQSIPSRFAKQVLRAPGALAVKFQERELTYEALDRESSRIANAILARRGPGQEPVALLFNQGIPMISAILGVLKAGKFYVPLDPQYPDARSIFILKDTNARLIIGDENSDQARRLATSKVNVLSIAEVNSYQPHNMTVAVSPNDLASVLYTYGSTGKPKGIMQTHRNLLGITMNFTNGLAISPTDRISLIPYYTFAAATVDALAALMNGAALFPYDIRRLGVASLAEWLRREKISVCHSAPTVFRHFVSALTGDDKFPHFRIMDLGGETVYSRDVELFRKHFPGCTMVNGLGSPELNVMRQFQITPDTQIADGIVPVGYAVEDTEILLLSESGDEVPPSETGEIILKSRYLSPGYWRRPDLDGEAFSTYDGERVWSTGDLGRMNPDGCLIHLGRKDFQVKIRGRRVEPGEIEMALLEIEGIKEAAVIARDYDGEKRLAAYLVAGESAPSTDSLCHTLLGRLPDYMVPSNFVLLDKLPVTETGKLDRRALSEMEFAQAEPYVAPRNPVEEILAEIWAETLEVDRVGINDSFFMLGGHSILLTRLLSQVREVFDAEIPFRSFFESPTVAGLAGLFEGNESFGNTLSQLVNQIDALSDEEAEALLSSEAASFIAEGKLVARQSPNRIASIVIATKDRPDALRRAVTSFVENCLEHERTADLLVCDDSSLPAARDKCRQALTLLAKRYDINIRYAGLEEKLDFAQWLADRGIPRQTADFALFDSEKCGRSCGANRNAALLGSVGDLVFSADDDTLCHSSVHPDVGVGVDVSWGSDPADFWFYHSREKAFSSAAFRDIDLLTGHERLLGCRAGDLDIQDTDLASADPRIRERIARGGKVLVTFNGLLGDCGWSAPFGFWRAPLGCLLLPRESHERLVSSESHYRMACSTREILRVVKRPAVSDDAFSMVTFMGLDNRLLLPPFMPVMRGQGLVFGRTLNAAFSNGLFGHVPFALIHSPMEQRSFWNGEALRTASGFDVARLVIECINTYHPDPGSGDEVGLRALGKHLLELGALPLKDFETAVRAQTRKTSREFISGVEGRLSDCCESPAFWANDVKKYVAIMLEHMDRPDSCVPLDLLNGRSAEDARELARRLVCRFGELLCWWPNIVRIARDLRNEGWELGRSLR